MGRRVIPLRHNEGGFLGWLFQCPGCECAHVLNETWAFTGTLERPTFHAGIRFKTRGSILCHSFITDGKIRYLLVSTHSLAGQEVDLPEF